MSRCRKLWIAFFLVGIFLFTPRLWAAPAIPEPVGYVNDFAAVLGDNERTDLEQLLVDLEQATGVEFAVVTVKDTTGTTPKEYAVALFNQWKIGKAGQDNGLLVLLAMAEREIQVEVGYGLEGDLPDGRVGQILDDYVVPHFRAGEMGQGLYQGARALAAVVYQGAGIENPVGADGQPLPGVIPPASPNRPDRMIVAVALLFLAMMLFGLFQLVRLGSKSRRCPNCGGTLRTSERVVSAATALRSGTGVRLCRCSACGYEKEDTFTIPQQVPMVGPFWGGSWRGGGRGGGGLGGGGFGGGGFGGFGGGGSGGGGAGRKW